MPYKGAIDAGSSVAVTLENFGTNSGAGFVLVGCATLAGESSADGKVVAPGTSVTVTLNCEEAGLLKVDVDLASDTDSGLLDVRVDNQPRDQGKIVGDTVWSYSVL